MFEPFEDDSSTFSIGEFTAENGLRTIAFYGNLDLTRDKVGLKRAQELKDLVDKIFSVLSSAQNLPDAVPDAVKASQTVKNPFAS